MEARVDTDREARAVLVEANIERRLAIGRGELWTGVHVGACSPLGGLFVVMLGGGGYPLVAEGGTRFCRVGDVSSSVLLLVLLLLLLLLLAGVGRYVDEVLARTVAARTRAWR